MWIPDVSLPKVILFQPEKSQDNPAINCPQAHPYVLKLANVGIAIINHSFLMVYTTHLWWLGGWFIIAIPTLPLKPSMKHHYLHTKTARSWMLNRHIRAPSIQHINSSRTSQVLHTETSKIYVFCAEMSQEHLLKLHPTTIFIIFMSHKMFRQSHDSSYI